MSEFIESEVTPEELWEETCKKCGKEWEYHIPKQSNYDESTMNQTASCDCTEFTLHYNLCGYDRDSSDEQIRLIRRSGDFIPT